MNTATEEKPALDHVRAMIREAYACELGAGVYKSSSLADMFTVPKQREKKTTKVRKFPYLTDKALSELTEEQRAKYQDALDQYHNRSNHRVQAKATFKPGRSIPIKYRGGYQWLLRRIASAPEKYKFMIWHIYKPDSGSKHVADLLDALWAEYEPTMGKAWEQTKDEAKRMMKVQITALNDPFKYESIHRHPWNYTMVSRTAWNKRFSDHWAAIKELIETVDAEALDYVTR